MVEIDFFRSGHDRNEDNALSHTYAETKDGELWPMCGYGWNRSNGSSFSILRGPPGSQGECRYCAKNIADGKPPVTNGFSHKTKWI